jgi:predicted nucleic acid-binding protein
MIDTSVLVAGLIPDHEFHAQARPRVIEAAAGRIPGPVLAEAWAVLRRAPWNLAPAVVGELLAPWRDPSRIVAPTATDHVDAVDDAARIGAGGGVHDLVIARTCAAAGLGLVTLDRRQAAVARELVGLDGVGLEVSLLV